ASRLAWALQTAIVLATRGDSEAATVGVDLPGVVAGINRARLDPAGRGVLDTLLADVLGRTRRGVEMRARLGRPAGAARAGDRPRRAETSALADLQRAVAEDEPSHAAGAWDDLIRMPVSEELQSEATARVAALAKGTARLQAWRRHLRATARDLGESAPAIVA